MLKPVFTPRPGINQAGGLELVGYFPTQPLRVQFHLEFQHVGSGWMIDTVSVTTAATQQQALQQAAPPQTYGTLRRMPGCPIWRTGRPTAIAASLAA